MTGTNATERARRVEDDYFRRKDAELIERARHIRGRAAAESALALEMRVLADALGVHDDRLVGTLHAAGFRPGSTALLDWLPAIEVAWADDVDMRERHELRLRIAADPRAAEGGLGVLTDFLFIQPTEDLLAAAREVLRRQLASMDPVSRHARIETILARCEAVAEASGGVWVLAAVSAEERRRIAAIRAALTGAEPNVLSGSSEFPH